MVDEDRAEEVVLRSDGTRMYFILAMIVESAVTRQYATSAMYGICIAGGVLVETCSSG